MLCSHSLHRLGRIQYSSAGNSSRSNDGNSSTGNDVRRLPCLRKRTATVASLWADKIWRLTGKSIYNGRIRGFHDDIMHLRYTMNLYKKIIRMIRMQSWKAWCGVGIVHRHRRKRPRFSSRESGYRLLTYLNNNLQRSVPCKLLCY